MTPLEPTPADRESVERIVEQYADDRGHFTHNEFDPEDYESEIQCGVRCILSERSRILELIERELVCIDIELNAKIGTVPDAIYVQRHAFAWLRDSILHPTTDSQTGNKA